VSHASREVRHDDPADRIQGIWLQHRGGPILQRDLVIPALPRGVVTHLRSSLGIEDEVGTLEPGKYADFVVLSENPLEVEPEKLKDIHVEATVMNGRITYFEAPNGLYHH
jgi:hypothetical protein